MIQSIGRDPAIRCRIVTVVHIKNLSSSCTYSRSDFFIFYIKMLTSLSWLELEFITILRAVSSLPFGSCCKPTRAEPRFTRGSLTVLPFSDQSWSSITKHTVESVKHRVCWCYIVYWLCQMLSQQFFKGQTGRMNWASSLPWLYQ